MAGGFAIVRNVSGTATFGGSRDRTPSPRGTWNACKVVVRFRIVLSQTEVCARFKMALSIRIFARSWRAQSQCCGGPSTIAGLMLHDWKSGAMLLSDRHPIPNHVGFTVNTSFGFSAAGAVLTGSAAKPEPFTKPISASRSAPLSRC